MMRFVRRNLVPMNYCTFDRKIKLMDAQGNWTGEWTYVYANPVETEVVPAPARGYEHADFYGRLDSSDVVVVSSDTSLPIDINTMIFLGKSPEYTKIYETVTENGREVTKEVTIPCGFNYSVRRVAKAPNTILYALMEVKTT